MAFKVTKIIDGSTIEVAPAWKWDNKSGNSVKITGFIVTDRLKQLVLLKLNTLLSGQSVDLMNPSDVSPGLITCSVYLNGVDILQYFPEFKVTSPSPYLMS